MIVRQGPHIKGRHHLVTVGNGTAGKIAYALELSLGQEDTRHRKYWDMAS